MQAIVNLNIKYASNTSIYNTYRLLAFDTIYHDCNVDVKRYNASTLKYYYDCQNRKMMPACYQHHRNVEHCKFIFSHFMFEYDWAYTCINTFDIYQIIFCIRFKKFKILEGIIKNMHVEAAPNEIAFKNICASLMNYITSIHDTTSYNKNLKATIIAVMFKFFYCTPLNLINEKLQKILVTVSDRLMMQINTELKYLPLYIKTLLIEQLSNVHTMLQVAS